jgi:hypothetical protein
MLNLLKKFPEPTKEELAFRERMKRLKGTLKQLASDIKYQKSIRKPSHKKYLEYRGHMGLSIKYRHLHVAYCLLRGRTLEQVDSGRELDIDYVNWIVEITKDDNRAKLYVCIDEKLSDAQKAVQGAHAVAQFIKDQKYTLWNNGTLVFVKYSCPNVSYCGWALSEVSNWREPDLKNANTASASFGPNAEKYFKGFKLV